LVHTNACTTHFHGCVGFVVDGYKEPKAPEEEAAMTKELKDQLRNSRKKDNKALCTIYQGVEEATFEIIAAARTSKEAWEPL